MEKTDYTTLWTKQSQFFKSGATRSLADRRKALTTLKQGMRDWEPRLMEAVWKDLHKSGFEAYTNELGTVHAEIDLALKKLGAWMKPRRVFPEIFLFPARGKIIPEPMGTSLIIAPWNYPVQLLLSPLVAALAAGNTAVLKPSELTAHSEQVLKDMISSLFAPEQVAIVCGGPEVTTELLKLPFQKIFFTGSPNVGKIVMRAGAEHLSSVSLELGGKSPAIVDSTTSIKTAARKIAWGKFNNAGQTCVAPDYVLVESGVRDQFLEELKKAIALFYGTDPKNSNSYGRIVNQRHFQRVSSYISQGTLVCGGQTDPSQNYIEPTVILPSGWDAPIMQDEIFGPVLPVLTFEKPEEVVALVDQLPDPLALYIFSSSRKNRRLWLDSIPFGGGGVNSTVLHVASSRLPFGGRGTSGIGNYHGKAGFNAFSHHKSILIQSANLDLGLNYPHKKVPLGIIKKFM